MLKWPSTQWFTPFKNSSFYMGLVWFLLLLLFLFFENSINHALFEQSQLNVSNSNYLQTLRASLTEELIVLKEIKALLATIETSQFGFSIIVDAKVTLGKEVSSLTDLANRGSLYLEVAIIATEVLILLSYLTHYILPIILLFIFVGLTLRSFAKWLDYSNIQTECAKLLKVLTMWFVMLHFAIPYSVHFAAAVSHHIEQNKRHELTGYAKHFHNELKQSQGHQSLSKKAKAMIHKGENLLTNFKHKVSSMFRYVSQLLLRKLLLALVIPLLLFGFLYFTLRYILNTTLLVNDEIRRKT